MIVLNLGCANDHRFEGWFASTDQFTSQTAKHLVSCPVCGSQEISKLPAGPRVRRAAQQMEPAREQAKGESYAMVRAAAKLVERLMLASEDVGERFPQEARLIHYDQAPARNIRGTATREEAGELLEEGILVVPLPDPPKSEFH